MRVGKVSIEGNNVRRIVDFIIESSDENYHISQAENVVVLMKEEWSMRLELAHLMSVFLFKFSGNDKVDIEVVSGGAEDDIFMFWSMEKSKNRRFVYNLKYLCQENGWEITSVFPKELEKPLLLDKLLKRKTKTKVDITGNSYIDAVSDFLFGDDQSKDNS